MNKFISTIIIAAICYLLPNFTEAAPIIKHTNIFQVIDASSPETTMQQVPITSLQDWLSKNPQDVNAIGLNGITPLIFAIQMRNFEAAKELLKMPQININTQDVNGKTPLHYAAAMDFKNISPDKQENSAEKIKDIINQLIQKGALLSAKDHQGHTPLDNAHPAIREYLQTIKNQQNNLLLLDGARRGDWRMVQLAMRDGADINTEDIRQGMNGNTALHNAVHYTIEQIKKSAANKENAFNFMRLILSYNPNIKIENKEINGKPGFTAYEAALMSPDLDIIKVFEEFPEERAAALRADNRYRPLS